MRQDPKILVVFAFFACISLVACGDDSSSSGPEGGESSAVEESSSSWTLSSDDSRVTDSLSSSNSLFSSSSWNGAIGSSSADSSAAVKADTTKITYALKPFDGPLANPHKGFTVPTGGAWTFVPEFEYGPYGSLNNRAWDLVSYGSGYQQWNKLNPAKGVYDWTELEKLLNALAEHNMTYALRVLPYTPSFIKSDFPPEEEYDWTPPFVYEMGAKKIQIDLRGTEYHAYAPVWDDPIYLQAAKEFAKALAEKYDGDPRIEYIDVRTFGEWGEWHTSHILGSEMPADSVLIDMLDKYKNFVRAKARSYFLIGADHEDIVQEGMIGLYKAIRDYRPEKLSSFRAFAELCITRQIITAIKTATRQKHIPLNSYVSLNKPLYDEESDRTLLDIIMEGGAGNPEDMIINQEDLGNIHQKINEVLSGLEQEVLSAYLDGKSYQEIAEALGRHVKSIDNALQRVKRKLEKYLEENGRF